MGGPGEKIVTQATGGDAEVVLHSFGVEGPVGGYCEGKGPDIAANRGMEGH